MLRSCIGSPVPHIDILQNQNARWHSIQVQPPYRLYVEFTFSFSCSICSLKTWAWRMQSYDSNKSINLKFCKQNSIGLLITLTFLARTFLTLLSNCRSICCSSSMEHDPKPSPKSFLRQLQMQHILSLCEWN